MLLMLLVLMLLVLQGSRRAMCAQSDLNGAATVGPPSQPHTACAAPPALTSSPLKRRPNTMTLDLRFSRMFSTIASFFLRVMALVTCGGGVGCAGERGGVRPQLLLLLHAHMYAQAWGCLGGCAGASRNALLLRCKHGEPAVLLHGAAAPATLHLLLPLHSGGGGASHAHAQAHTTHTCMLVRGALRAAMGAACRCTTCCCSMPLRRWGFVGVVR